MSQFKSSLNSQRSSPFRRPASPNTPTINNSNGTPGSRNGASPMTSPSKLKQSYTVSEEDVEEEEHIINTPTRETLSMPSYSEQPSPSPRRLPNPPMTQDSMAHPPPLSFSPSSSVRQSPSHNNRQLSFSQTDNLSKLPPQLLNSIRESFSVLDTDSTGTITPSDISETLHSLGLQETNISQFFPAGQPQSVSLPQYLNQLAALLVELSPQQELLNALSAFDDDDSGQIDTAELRAALLSTVPDPGERQLTERDIDRAMEGFTGRRILSKNSIGMGIPGVRNINPTTKKTGDVFRYQEFVSNLTGGPSVENGASAPNSGGQVKNQAVSAR